MNLTYNFSKLFFSELIRDEVIAEKKEIQNSNSSNNEIYIMYVFLNSYFVIPFTYILNYNIWYTLKSAKDTYDTLTPKNTFEIYLK